MKKFSQYIQETRLPRIPSKKRWSKSVSTKKLISPIANNEFEIIRTEANAKEFLLNFLSERGCPLFVDNTYLMEYKKDKELYKKAWEDFMEDLHDNSDPENGTIYFGYPGTYYSTEEITLDELMQFLVEGAGIDCLIYSDAYVTIMYGGAIYPLDKNDEYTSLMDDVFLPKEFTDEKYEIKRIYNTDVVMKDKENNIVYFK